MELEPPRTPERPPTPRAADPRELERMRARVRELEGRLGETESRLGAVEEEKGELERENHLIKALLPPLSPAAQALISLAAGGRSPSGSGRVGLRRPWKITGADTPGAGRRSERPKKEDPSPRDKLGLYE